MPKRYPETRSLLFAVAGGPTSGKSTFLAMMLQELSGNLTDYLDGAIMPEDEWTRQQVKSFQRLTKEGHMLPPTLLTRENGYLRPLLFQLRLKRPRLIPLLGPRLVDLTLIFFDAAGEAHLTPEHVERYLRYLGKLHGVMFFFDPLNLSRVLPDLADPTHLRPQPEATPEEILSTVTDELVASSTAASGRRRLQVPLALVVSKVDELKPDLLATSPLLQSQSAERHSSDRREVHEFVRSLLNKWSSGADNYLTLHYRTHGLFAVSALGAPARDGQVAPGGLRPYRVVDPQLWLLAKKKIL